MRFNFFAGVPRCPWFLRRFFTFGTVTGRKIAFSPWLSSCRTCMIFVSVQVSYHTSSCYSAGRITHFVMPLIETAAQRALTPHRHVILDHVIPITQACCDMSRPNKPTLCPVYKEHEPETLILLVYWWLPTLSSYLLALRVTRTLSLTATASLRTASVTTDTTGSVAATEPTDAKPGSRRRISSW